MPHLVPLSDLIEGIREELEKSMLKGNGRPLRFSVDDIELEAQVSVCTSDQGEAKISVYAIELGRDGGHSRSITHTVRINLTPSVIRLDDDLNLFHGRAHCLKAPVRIREKH